MIWTQRMRSCFCPFPLQRSLSLSHNLLTCPRILLSPQGRCGPCSSLFMGNKYNTYISFCRICFYSAETLKLLPHFRILEAESSTPMSSKQSKRNRQFSPPLSTCHILHFISVCEMFSTLAKGSIWHESHSNINGLSAKHRHNN